MTNEEKRPYPPDTTEKRVQAEGFEQRGVVHDVAVVATTLVADNVLGPTAGAVGQKIKDKVFPSKPEPSTLVLPPGIDSKK